MGNNWLTYYVSNDIIVSRLIFAIAEIILPYKGKKNQLRSFFIIVFCLVIFFFKNI